MRRVVTIVTAGALLTACGTGQAMRRGGEKVGEGLGDAVTAPLEDLNLKRDKIPAVLIRSKAAPYDLERMTSCEAIAAEVGALDDALGRDMDEPPPPDPRTRVEKGADAGAKAALGAVRDTATDIIPLRSWVRRLTGAERHSRQVRDAVQAGMVRRGFLKGQGMNLNCAPPAAPSWFVPERAEPQPEPARKPRPARKRRN